MSILFSKLAVNKPDHAAAGIVIGGVNYAMAPVPGVRRCWWLTRLPAAGSLTRRLKERTVYTVRQYDSGVQGCNCPVCVPTVQRCEHIDAMQALGILEPEPVREAYRSAAEAAEHVEPAA